MLKTLILELQSLHQKECTEETENADEIKSVL
jgi:hypothetical protein